ncbi:MAG: hypothetical protein JWQ71_324, partial [Pedosphaera sp.]|nr:hypothetical protein [Pedosphaera sp.]
VWSPSWVTWRSFGDFCGWAPLSPFDNGFGSRFRHSDGFRHGKDGFGHGRQDFNFVDLRHFGSRNLRPFRLNESHVNNFFDRSLAFNNFGIGPDNTFINRGFDFNRIAAFSRDPILRANIQDVPLTSINAARFASTVGNDGAIRVFRPQLLNNPQPTSAESVRIDPHLTPATLNNGRPNQRAAIGSRPVILSPNAPRTFNPNNSFNNPFNNQIGSTFGFNGINAGQPANFGSRGGMGGGHSGGARGGGGGGGGSGGGAGGGGGGGGGH